MRQMRSLADGRATDALDAPTMIAILAAVGIVIAAIRGVGSRGLYFGLGLVVFAMALWLIGSPPNALRHSVYLKPLTVICYAVSFAAMTGGCVYHGRQK